MWFSLHEKLLALNGRHVVLLCSCLCWTTLANAAEYRSLTTKREPGAYTKETLAASVIIIKYCLSAVAILHLHISSAVVLLLSCVSVQTRLVYISMNTSSPCHGQGQCSNTLWCSCLPTVTHNTNTHPSISSTSFISPAWNYSSSRGGEIQASI